MLASGPSLFREIVPLTCITLFTSFVLGCWSILSVVLDRDHPLAYPPCPSYPYKTPWWTQRGWSIFAPPGGTEEHTEGLDPGLQSFFIEKLPGRIELVLE